MIILSQVQITFNNNITSSSITAHILTNKLYVDTANKETESIALASDNLSGNNGFSG
jgi:hypothetical protein